jgi:heme A synthase
LQRSPLYNGHLLITVTFVLSLCIYPDFHLKRNFTSDQNGIVKFAIKTLPKDVNRLSFNVSMSVRLSIFVGMYSCSSIGQRSPLYNGHLLITVTFVLSLCILLYILIQYSGHLFNVVSGHHLLITSSAKPFYHDELDTKYFW